MVQNQPQSTSIARWIVLLAGGLLCAVLVLLILSNALASWGTASWYGGSVSVGLWRDCKGFTSFWGYYYNDECFTTRLTCSNVWYRFYGQCLKLMVTRSFIILACIFSGFGTILLVIIGITGINNSVLLIVGKVLVILSSICSIIGFSVGLSWILYNSNMQLGAAAILAIIAAGVNIISVVLILLVR